MSVLVDSNEIENLLYIDDIYIGIINVIVYCDFL
jgi:hypothetical protein